MPKAKAETFDEIEDRARRTASLAITHLVPEDQARLRHALELGRFDTVETLTALAPMDQRAVLALARWAILMLP
jgi:hypothetical protein